MKHWMVALLALVPAALCLGGAAAFMVYLDRVSASPSDPRACAAAAAGALAFTLSGGFAFELGLALGAQQNNG